MPTYWIGRGDRQPWWADQLPLWNSWSDDGRCDPHHMNPASSGGVGSSLSQGSMHVGGRSNG